MGKRFMGVILAALTAAAALTGCFQGQSICLSEPAAESETAVLPEEDGSSEPQDLMEERQEEFEGFLEGVNERRQAIYTGGVIVPDEAWMPDLKALEGDFSDEEMKELMVKAVTRKPGSVSVQEAAEDIETAFRLLKNAYGAYDYFGGDEVFLPLKEAVLDGLPEAGTVSAGDLERGLYEQLAPVLADGHFAIGSKRTFDLHNARMYYVPGLYFDSPADVQGVDAALIKPTIGEEGRLCYTLAEVLSKEQAENLPETAVIAGEEAVLCWQGDSYAYADSGDVFTERTLEDGTPWLDSSSMWAGAEAEQEQLQRLADCGAEYADAPVLIMDVRGNGGGNDMYVSQWFYGYTGVYAPRRIFSVLKFSPLNILMYRTNKSFVGLAVPDSPCWSGGSNPGAFLSHDGLTILLQDKGTASAGESAVEELRTLENTLVVGSNTMGCSLTPNVTRFVLPHSGLTLQMGTGLSFSETAENRDGTGYLPDLWVPSEEALERVEKMIRYYGLREKFS